ncbi:MAG TPA: 30S ribosomal protein S5 [Nitrospiria bacterium]
MKVNPNELNLKDKVVFINRVTKVVKGGKRFSFSALVVIGDGNGWVAMGNGKAAEVPDAIRKAVDQAKKHLIKIPLKDKTIHYAVTGFHTAEEVLLKPAPEGTGVIAGGPVRAVMEVCGIRNVISKSLGGGNPNNVVRATLAALSDLRTPESIYKLRQSDEKEGADHAGQPAA